VAQALSEMRWTRDITGPLSIQAMEQYSCGIDLQIFLWPLTATTSYLGSGLQVVVILPALHILHCTMEQLSSTVQIAFGRLGHLFGSSFSFGLLSSIDIGLLIDAFDMG